MIIQMGYPLLAFGPVYFTLYVFRKCVSEGCNISNISARHEKLVGKQELGCDEVFDLQV